MVICFKLIPSEGQCHFVLYRIRHSILILLFLYLFFQVLSFL